jgi:hypothetical protein
MNYSEFLNKSYDELIKDTAFKEFSLLMKEKIDADFFLGDKKDGVVFSFSNEERLYQIDFYSEGYEDYKQFKGQLPHDITFDLSKKQINDLLGNPTVHQESRNIPILGIIPGVDSYTYQDHRLVFHYSENYDSLLLLTLTTR